MTAIWSLWTSIILGGVAQIALKRGVTTLTKNGGATGLPAILQLLKSGWIWLYGLCFCAATGLWLLALSGLDISYAFPLMASSYVLVAILARLFLRESVPPGRWMAICVICIGVVIIARS